MRRIEKISTLFALAVIGSDTACAAEMPDIPPAFARIGLRSGMRYPAARRTLSRAGYNPAKLTNDACSSAGGKTCRIYREIEACSGTGAGFCSARFTDRHGRVFAVITVGPAGRLIRIFANPGLR